jgi:hypothetical protein
MEEGGRAVVGEVPSIRTVVWLGGGRRRGLEAHCRGRLCSGLCGKGREAEKCLQVSGLMTA